MPERKIGEFFSMIGAALEVSQQWQ